MLLYFNRYPGLTIKYVRGADPIIKLLDDDEFTVEVSSGSLLAAEPSLVVVFFFVYTM